MFIIVQLIDSFHDSRVTYFVVTLSTSSMQIVIFIHDARYKMITMTTNDDQSSAQKYEGRQSNDTWYESLGARMCD